MKKSLVPLQSLRYLLCAFAISAIGSIAPTHSFANSIPFTKNMGQWPDSILYRASANGATMWFTKNGIWYQFFKTIERVDASALGAADVPSASGFVGDRHPFLPHEDQSDSILTTMVKAEFVGASESVEVIGLEEMEYKCNYFIGNDESQWRSNVPNYTAVTMKGLYPGVDVSFSSKDGLVREEMTASSSEALAQVKVEYRGASSAAPLTSSSTAVQTSLGEHQFEGIMLADPSSTKFDKPTASSASTSENAVSLVYSTYLGGSGGGSHGFGIAVDASENAYVTGSTGTASFPTQFPLQGFAGTTVDGFISKLGGAGNGLIYSTFLGGSGGDICYGIAVDIDGNAYIIGQTQSLDFPVQSPIQEFSGGSSDAFVVKINSDGSALIFSTYHGGGGFETADAIAVDNERNVHITGSTNSTDFPTQNAAQATFGGGRDGYVTKFDSSGSAMIYSSYLGGSIGDYSDDIAVDSVGNSYVTGGTYSEDFPTLNPFQTANAYPADAFVSKFDGIGGGLVYSTYLGGGFGDYGLGIAVDANENVFVMGATQSEDFPTVNSFQVSGNGSTDLFVTKFNSVGSGIIYSTYLGGSSQDDGHALTIDNHGCAIVIGYTGSRNFPTLNPFQAVNTDGDVIVTKLNSSGNALMYGTFLGGNGFEIGEGISVDADGDAYATGFTVSSDFPLQNALQSSFSGGADAFVTKLAFAPCCTGPRGNVNGDAGDAVNVGDITFLVQYLFQNGAEPPCMDEANVAVNGTLNIIDITTLVSYLMAGGPPPPSCP